ncbi:MAG: flagellar hook-associated protein FlgL [Pigmentiphaga sp.]|nr:flagellar hook-associated protein FlgL [Pigmentiphaga sp.]
MRISTNQFYNSSISSLSEQQVQLAKVNQQIAAQRTLINPADDPIAASKEVQLSNKIQVTEQMLRNQSDLKGQLELSESTLIEAGSALQSVYSRLVQAGNPGLSDESRASLATDITSLKAQILGIANTQDESGNFVFAGYKQSTEPFVQTTSGIVYQGDGGVRQSQIGANRLVDVNLTGQYLFVDIPTGHSGINAEAGPANTGTLLLTQVSLNDRTAWEANRGLAPFEIEFGADGAYTVMDNTNAVVSSGVLDAGANSLSVGGISVSVEGTPNPGDTIALGASGNESVFDTLDRAIAVLSKPDSDGVSIERNNELFQAVQSVQNALARVMEGRTQLGSRLNEVEAASTNAQARADQLTEQLTKTVGADTESQIALASELAKRSYAVEAAQMTYAKVSQLSIFNFIK